MRSASLPLTMMFTAFVLLPGFADAAVADFPFQVAGVNWSADLGLATNGCENALPDGAPTCGEPSKAEALCASIGGRLPTELEYRSVLQLVEAQIPGSTRDERLATHVNYEGWQLIRHMFIDENPTVKYWTSTPGFVSWDEVPGSAAYTFGVSRGSPEDSPYYASLYAAGKRGFAAHVRCVQQ